MNSDVSKRFIACHDALKCSGKIKSSRQFAMSLQYAPQSFSDITKGKRDVTIELLRKAREVYGINMDFIFSGEGKMFFSEKTEAEEPIVTVVTDQKGEERIVHVPIAAQAGYGGQLSDVEFMKDLPTFTLPGKHFNRGTFRCFDISGDSMEPTIYTGEKVVCSFLEKDSWINSLRDNYVYVVATENSVVVKRLINNLSVGHEIVLHSDNKFYEPYSLHGNDICEIWKVEVKISPFMHSPSNARNALHAEIEHLKKTATQQSQLIDKLNRMLEKYLDRSTRVY